MIEFNESFNYDDVFIRDVTIALVSEFYRRVRWVNNFKDQKRLVTIPFTYANIGDERMLMDAFVDDITGERPELNYDAIPRGKITLENWSVKQGEFSNPNVDFHTYEEENGVLKRVVGKYRPLPVKLNYNIEILLDPEIDLWKCTQSLWDFFWIYKFFHIEFKSVRIDCKMYTTNDFQAEIERQIQGLQGETDKKIKFPVEVHSFYPIPPIENRSTPINRKVVFKGNMWTLKGKRKKKTWLGNDANKKE